MATHFIAPNSPGTLRVSVTSSVDVYVADLPAAKLPEAVEAFQDFAGLDTSPDNWAAVAAEADETGDCYLVCVAALWLFVHLPEAEHVMNRERLTTIVNAGGIAVLTVTMGSRQGDWRFRLHEMPQRASISPADPYAKRRRRWR